MMDVDFIQYEDGPMFIGSEEVLAARDAANAAAGRASESESEAQDAAARANASAESLDASNIVHVTEQDFTAAQKAQGRINIGAASVFGFNVRDYGAVGDGVTNDAASIQSAIASAVAAGGGLVLIPEGKYRVNSTVTVQSNGVRIQGAGPGATWIINGTTNRPAVQFGSSAEINRCGISGVVFSQAADVTPVSPNTGLLVQNMSNFIMTDVEAFQFPAPLYYGIRLDNVKQSYMLNCSAQDCLYSGFRISNSLDMTWSGGRSDANAQGVEIVDTDGLYFTGVTAYGNTNNAWLIRSVSGGTGNHYHFFTNCVGDTSGSHNWNIGNLIEGLFTNCWGSTQLNAAANTTAAGFYLSSAAVDGVLFDNCLAISNNGHGFWILAARRVSLSNCKIGSERDPFNANGKANAGNGIQIGSDTSRINVTGGLIAGNTLYGVGISAGAQMVILSGIDFRWNPSGSVNNEANASGANVEITNCPGFSPAGGGITTPPLPASGAEIVNTTGVDCMVYISGGSVSALYVAGYNMFPGGTPIGNVLVNAGSTIRIDYSATPQWVWSGL